MDINSGEKPSEYKIIELAKYIIHKQYCKKDVQSVISKMDKDIIWNGPEEDNYASGIKEVEEFLNKYNENAPAYNISDEEYNTTQISNGIYLCSGRMRIETYNGADVVSLFYQKVVLIFRWYYNCLKCCYINFSNVYKNIGGGQRYRVSN